MWNPKFVKPSKFAKGAPLTLALAFGMALSGCGSAGNAGSTGNGTAAADPVPAATNTEQTQPVDNKLVVYTAGPEGLANKLIEGYQADSGVQVDVFQGTTGKILARLEAEKSNPAADVVILASLPAAQGLKDDGLTMAYADAANADKLNPDWSDADGHYFGASASALGIAYNTNLITTPPTSWADLSKSEYKDQINLPDPSLSGSALDFMTGYLNVNGDSGWELFESYKANGAALAGANKEALDPVITGAKGIVASAVDYMTYSAKAKGEPIDIVYPSEGTVVSPRPVAILNSTQHEANAKSFVDYMLSDEAQKMVTDAYLMPGRTDIKADNRANLDEIPELKVDWNWMSENGAEVTERVLKIFK